MAKGKVHKAGMPEESGPRGALCRQKHRTLLPLAIVDDWRAVTCEKCLGKRPESRGWTLVGSPLAGAYGWLRARFWGPR